ncbi:dTMP kinase [Vermiphilus pyriformis]|nr:MAG: dTMP kinase [Vermiphilus pyriformis]
MRTLSQGLLISLEGIDGSGKSTLVQKISELLSQEFYVCTTREPGATQLGKTIRSLVQEYRDNLDARAEFLLFAADRAQHFTHIISPALKKGHIVVSDRLSDSSRAYQGYGRGLDLNTIDQVNRWAMCNRQPDIVFYLEVAVSTAHDRRIMRAHEQTRFEQLNQDFFEKVAHGFKVMSQQKHWVVLDGNQSIAELSAYTCNYIKTWITSHNL